MFSVGQLDRKGAQVIPVIASKKVISREASGNRFAYRGEDRWCSCETSCVVKADVASNEICVAGLRWTTDGMSLEKHPARRKLVCQQTSERNSSGLANVNKKKRLGELGNHLKSRTISLASDQ